MSKLFGLIAVVAIGMWTMQGFGGLFGLSHDEVKAIEAMKNKAIDRAAPVVDPVVSKQNILDAQEKIEHVLPSPAEVQSAMETQIVPAVIGTARKLGEAAQKDLGKHVPPTPAAQPAPQPVANQQAQEEPSSLPVYMQ